MADSESNGGRACSAAHLFEVNRAISHALILQSLYPTHSLAWTKSTAPCSGRDTPPTLSEAIMLYKAATAIVPLRKKRKEKAKKRREELVRLDTSPKQERKPHGVLRWR